jgi:hypothetical protein
MLTNRIDKKIRGAKHCASIVIVLLDIGLENYFLSFATEVDHIDSTWE